VAAAGMMGSRISMAGRLVSMAVRVMTIGMAIRWNSRVGRRGWWIGGRKQPRRRTVGSTPSFNFLAAEEEFEHGAELERMPSDRLLQKGLPFGMAH